MDMRIGIGAAFAVLLFAQPAVAFQETSVSGAGQEQNGASAAGSAAVDGGLVNDNGAGVELVAPDEGDSNSGGTEVRIPGFGRLGVIPKLDFGLELLYGAGEQDNLVDDSTDDEITIRGRVKHKF